MFQPNGPYSLKKKKKKLKKKYDFFLKKCWKKTGEKFEKKYVMTRIGNKIWQNIVTVNQKSEN